STGTKIATANGTLGHSLPSTHGGKVQVTMVDVLVHYEFDGQRLHRLSLQSAERSSPHFEDQEEDILQVHNKRHDFLFDFNLSQLELILKCLKLRRDIVPTSTYIPLVEPHDFRREIHPKKESVWTAPKPYYQVFSEKHGFLPELSIVDLLFNQGPQSRNYL